MEPGKSDVENRLSTINVSWLFPCCSKSAASGERESNSVAGTYLGSKYNLER
jgi:hypothetical protein